MTITYTKRGRAERWRAARLAAGWSQYELAKRSGLHPATISAMERGVHVSAETAAKLDAALGLAAELGRGA